MAEVLPPLIEEHEIDLPEPVNKLMLLYASPLTDYEGYLRAKNVYVYDADYVPEDYVICADDILKEHGLDRKDPRTQDMIGAIRVLANSIGPEAPSYDLLNRAIFYRSTGMYTEEEMTVLISQEIHPVMFEWADEWQRQGKDITEVFSKVLDQGKELVALADYLVRYTEENEWFEEALSGPVEEM
jgi:hypothetical protein